MSWIVSCESLTSFARRKCTCIVRLFVRSFVNSSVVTRLFTRWHVLHSTSLALLNLGYTELGNRLLEVLKPLTNQFLKPNMHVLKNAHVITATAADALVRVARAGQPRKWIRPKEGPVACSPTDNIFVSAEDGGELLLPREHCHVRVGDFPQPILDSSCAQAALDEFDDPDLTLLHDFLNEPLDLTALELGVLEESDFV